MLVFFLCFQTNLRIFTHPCKEIHNPTQNLNVKSISLFNACQLARLFFVSFLNLSNDSQCEIESLLLVSNRFFIVKSKYRISNGHECIQWKQTANISTLRYTIQTVIKSALLMLVLCCDFCVHYAWLRAQHLSYISSYRM